VDLIDEAASRLRIEIDSVPMEIDEFSGSHGSWRSSGQA